MKDLSILRKETPIFLDDKHRYFLKLTQQTSCWPNGYWFDLGYAADGFKDKNTHYNVLAYMTPNFSENKIDLNAPDGNTDIRMVETLIKYSALLLTKLGLRPKDFVLTFNGVNAERVCNMCSPAVKRFTVKKKK